MKLLPLSALHRACALASLTCGLAAGAYAANPAAPASEAQPPTAPSPAATQDLSAYASHDLRPDGLTITTTSSQKLRVRTYTDAILRVQATLPGQDFLPDDHYEIVTSHSMGGQLHATDRGDHLEITTGSLASRSIRLTIHKNPLRLQFADAHSGRELLSDQQGINWTPSHVSTHFAPDVSEHFAGFGHGGRDQLGFRPGKAELRLDLRGREIATYGSMGRLNVPFYLSSKGYGLYYNLMFPWTFRYNAQSAYGADFDDLGTGAEMDYFFILGPRLEQVLDRYTQLTGRPRFPRIALFGLHMTDNEGPGKQGSEEYWKREITQLRELGFGFDHAVFDNDWRAASERPGIKPQAGGWGGSQFRWRKDYYPDPAEFGAWLKTHGVILTLDLNRNIVKSCWGWQDSFNIPGQKDWPDFTNKAVRDWIWAMLWHESLNPELHYPGDSIWLDEMESMDGDAKTALSNGRLIGEMRTYGPFLIGKAVCGEGWDNEDHGAVPGIGEAKRPWIWNRAGSAGAQRYLTYWTGDIPFTYESMQSHVIAMQRAGLSGFPYFNHDAGGFARVDKNTPGDLDDAMYQQWAMAWGSFTPIWRPHGYGQPRWPQRRYGASREIALKYDHLRYELMPYLYTYAWQAHETGMPMARAMALEYQHDEAAWQHDMQYLWGKEMLIAPNCSGAQADVSVWFPPGGGWYDFWTDTRYRGGDTISYPAPLGVLPVFIREGAIVPRYTFAQSTAFIDKQVLTLDVYAGADGQFQLYEDDGVTERFRTRSEKSLTPMQWNDATRTLAVSAAQGTYVGAPTARSYIVRIHGLSADAASSVNGVRLETYPDLPRLGQAGSGVAWEPSQRVLEVHTPCYSTSQPVTISFTQSKRGRETGSPRQ